MIRVMVGNETFVKIACDDWGVEQELSDYFTFYAPGYKYMPAFRNGIWDGKIKLFDTRKKTIYKGLINDLVKFAKNREHEIEVDSSLRNSNDVSESVSNKFVDALDLHARGEKLEVREYQYQAIHRALSNDRQLLLSPTASGKSLIIMSIIRWHLAHKRKILIIVPTTMLVEQLYSDFEEYTANDSTFTVEDNISTLYSGKERIFEKGVVISTWQSLASMMKSDIEKFKELTDRTEVGIWDEAHSYKASVVLSVMEKFTKTKYRIGTTGTLDDSKINALTLTGLIGPIHKVISTKQLMDNKQVVELEINCTLLQYPEHIRKAYKGISYQDEISFLVGYEPRNKFIAKLASVVKGNTLILFNFVDRHGAVLEKMIRELTDRKVFFIHGGVDSDERETIRKLLSTETDAIVVATASLMSTGVNIPSIENVIFAIPSKSTIRIRQSIGRGLRLNSGKTKCNLYDIADDLSYKSYKNTTLNHLEERIGIYEKECFVWKLRKLNIG